MPEMSTRTAGHLHAGRGRAAECHLRAYRRRGGRLSREYPEIARAPRTLLHIANELSRAERAASAGTLLRLLPTGRILVRTGDGAVWGVGPSRGHACRQ